MPSYCSCTVLTVRPPFQVSSNRLVPRGLLGVLYSVLMPALYGLKKLNSRCSQAVICR